MKPTRISPILVGIGRTINGKRQPDNNQDSVRLGDSADEKTLNPSLLDIIAEKNKSRTPQKSESKE